MEEVVYRLSIRLPASVLAETVWMNVSILLLCTQNLESFVKGSNEKRLPHANCRYSFCFTLVSEKYQHRYGKLLLPSCYCQAATAKLLLPSLVFLRK
jgi:hypothetical protein